MVIFMIFLIVFFGLPILSGDVPIPKNFSASEIGLFIGSTFKYWRDVITHALRELGYLVIHEK